MFVCKEHRQSWHPQMCLTKSHKNVYSDLALRKREIYDANALPLCLNCLNKLCVALLTMLIPLLSSHCFQNINMHLSLSPHTVSFHHISPSWLSCVTLKESGLNQHSFVSIFYFSVTSSFSATFTGPICPLWLCWTWPCPVHAAGVKDAPNEAWT